MRVTLSRCCSGQANNRLFGLQRAQGIPRPAGMNKVDDASPSARLELAQCHIRVFVALPILIGRYLFWYMQARSTVAYSGVAGWCGCFAFARAHWAHVNRYPGFYPLRRGAAIVMDQLG